jgi:hypothetical protein
MGATFPRLALGARSMPAFVRSEIRSRSCCAMAARRPPIASPTDAQAVYPIRSLSAPFWRRESIEFFQEGRGPRWLLSQYLVNERDRDRPFADSRGHAFDVAATNIPGSEYSGHTAFQEVGPTGERPVRAGQLF